jgi:hypothetical protein
VAPAAVVVVPGGEAQGGQQPSGQQPSGEKQSGQQQSGQQTGKQETGGAESAGQRQAAQQPAGEPQKAEQPGAAGQGAEAQDKEGAGGTRTVAATPAPATGGDAGEKPCEEQVADLEKDLQRAEELGIAIDDAQSEFDEARAMLNNKSEALCRAAIKRAQEELTAVGFEPAESN